MKVDKKEYVYEFCYNSDCSETYPITISIHKTSEGANEAMIKHKAVILIEYVGDCLEYEGTKEFPWDFNKSWKIRKTELLH